MITARLMILRSGAEVKSDALGYQCDSLYYTAWKQVI